MNVLRAEVGKFLPVQPDSKDFKLFVTHIVSVAYSFYPLMDFSEGLVCLPLT